MVKTVIINLDETEYNALKKAKNDKTWKEYLVAPRLQEVRAK